MTHCCAYTTPGSWLICKSCFFLLCGRLADLYGRKLVFLIGSAWMCIFGLGCGFARSSSQLLVLRGFQGIGGAASITASVSDPSAIKLVYKFTPTLRIIASLHVPDGHSGTIFPSWIYTPHCVCHIRSRRPVRRRHRPCYRRSPDATNQASVTILEQRRFTRLNGIILNNVQSWLASLLLLPCGSFRSFSMHRVFLDGQ